MQYNISSNEITKQNQLNATLAEMYYNTQQHNQPHRLNWHGLQNMLAIIWHNVETTANDITPQLLHCFENSDSTVTAVKLWNSVGLLQYTNRWL